MKKKLTFNRFVTFTRKEVKRTTEGKTRHWLERYHVVASTLALGFKIDFDQPIKWMEFQ